MNLDRMMCLEGQTVEASAAALNELEAFAEQTGTVYAHEWRRGDVVVFDNRVVQHRAAPKDMVQPGDRRVLWQMMVGGEAPF